MLRQSSGPPTSNPWCCKEWSVPVLSSRLCLYPWPSGLATLPFHQTVVAEGYVVPDDATCSTPSLASTMITRIVRSYWLLACIPEPSSCLASGVNPSRLMKRKSRLNASTVHGAGCCRLHATRCPKVATGDESATPCHVFSVALTLNEFVILYRWNSCLARKGISHSSPVAWPVGDVSTWWWVPFLRVAVEIAFLEPYITAPLPAPSAAALLALE